ncbi:Crp/Fnr family transcriptional regulator [Nitrospira sp. KM1]|uniref:Crp/Fnr family transcriptional regulator n=1 Tax=Nitrospira sp. KM1 TaxID=1936990 RepID=UPI001566923A|nr:Crp/Fnr family transcriptional regulator [Nitrospira sp. KM1]
MKTSTQEANRLLMALREPERKPILQKLRRVTMKVRSKIYEKNRPIKKIYFPLSGVYSIVSDTKDGKTAEVATVGNEGVLGLPVFFQTETVPLRAFTQVAGECLVMNATDFRSITTDASSSFCRLLYRYAQALFNQIAQHAACSAVHSIEERCARWLLMTHDRVVSDEFTLTQEFLAQMLGVRRATVSLAASGLQHAGLITYRRGIIRILDREALESASCEHYALIRDEYHRLAPPA